MNRDLQSVDSQKNDTHAVIMSLYNSKRHCCSPRHQPAQVFKIWRKFYRSFFNIFFYRLYFGYLFLLLQLVFLISNPIGVTASPAADRKLITNSKKIATAANADDLDMTAILHQLQRDGHIKDQDMQWTPSKKFMINLFRNLRKEENIGNSSGQIRKSRIQPSDTVRSYSAKVPPPTSQQQRCRKLVYEFEIPKLPIHERTNVVEFRVHYPTSPIPSDNSRSSVLHGPCGRRNLKYRRWVVVVKQNGVRLHKSTKRYRPARENAYDVFNITKVVAPWLNAKHGNLTVVVRERVRGEKDDDYNDKNDKIDAELQNRNVSHGDGLLVLYSGNSLFFYDIYKRFTTNSEDVSSRRKRRQSRQTKSKRRRQRQRKKQQQQQQENIPCGLYDYYIDFNVIGWGEWIVFPKRFNAHLCSGSCPTPMNVELNPTNHAMLRSLMKLKQPDVTPLPCCVPTKLKPISLLYLEPDEIVLRQHADVVAEECGCR